MVKRKLKALHTIVLLWIFLKLGTKLFTYTREHHNNYGRTTAMLFAQNEREATISARSFVEWLDEQGKTAA